MYEPPEAEIVSDQPMSRRYDVWAMGCVCLEFLIWRRCALPPDVWSGTLPLHAKKTCGWKKKQPSRLLQMVVGVG